MKHTLMIFLSAALSLRAAADLGALDPLAKPSTRLGPGYLLALNVSVNAVDEEELCGQFLLDRDGQLSLTVGFRPMKKIPLKGATAAEAQQKILAAIRGYFVVAPEVRAGIARMPRIQVVVEGATLRNGPLTLPEGAHLSDALAETHYLPGTDLEHIQITRIEQNGTRVKLTADFGKVLQGAGEDRFNDPILQTADRVTLTLSPLPFLPTNITVLGEVRTPGVYRYQPDMTVRDALRAARGMLPTADPERVTISRARTNAFMTVNGDRAMQNIPTDNLKLQPDDTLFVMVRDSGLRYAVVGEVAAPTTFDYKKKVTIKQAIADAGGFKPGADRRSVVLLRNMLHDPTRAEAIPINFDRIAKGEQQDIDLLPGDMVQVSLRKKPDSPLLNIGLILLKFFLF